MGQNGPVQNGLLLFSTALQAENPNTSLGLSTTGDMRKYKNSRGVEVRDENLSIPCASNFCRKAGARFDECFLQDLDLLAPTVHDARRFEVAMGAVGCGHHTGVGAPLGRARFGAAYVDGAVVVQVGVLAWEGRLVAGWWKQRRS